MITCERKGTYTVHFGEMNSYGPVGKIEGDTIPVYVHKDSLSPVLGDTWICRLVVNNGPNGVNYFAILLDKVDKPAASEEVEEQKVAAEVETTVEEVTEETYVIDDKDDEEEFKIVDPKSRIVWSDVVVYAGNNTLRTDMLEDGRYIAYASLDGKRISIIPNKDGDLCCNRGEIQMDGLDDMMREHPHSVLGHTEKGGVLTVHIIDLVA